tara:strand:+ start:926 stop:1030 length:105 start_codon:yes stop_codon:yes gene_type:complete
MFKSRQLGTKKTKKDLPGEQQQKVKNLRDLDLPA